MDGRANDTIGCLSPASFRVPEHMTPSAWIEHGPFGFWLVETLAPRRFVELGVGNGFSYFCLCQGIRRAGLATEAFGVDRWDDESRAEEAEAANQRYAAFSTLVRTSFDVAATGFAPASVDLLHIDGDGEEDAASTLATWRPRLAENALLLLHGSPALYEKLCSQHPAIRFPQGSGLGVVALGGTVPAPLRTLLIDPDPAEADRIRHAYAALGGALRTRRELIANREGLKRLLRTTEVDRDGEADRPQRFPALPAKPRADREHGPNQVVSPRPEGDPEDVASTADVERLQAKLRDSRASEASAQRLARAVRRALQARHGELTRQALELENAAALARAEVIQLAADAWKLMEVEHAASAALVQAQARMDELLRHEQHLLRPRRDLKHILSLGPARRIGRQATTYRALVARMGKAAADLRDARQRHEVAMEAHRQGEHLAVSAEPRASELASAAVVLRGEHANAEEILAMLPPEPGGDQVTEVDEYARWVDLYDTITEGDRRGIKARLLRLEYKPTISIVMPVYDPPIDVLRQAIASVQAQLYAGWELCIADDASPNPSVAALLRSLAADDPRIKLIERASNGHISAASNSALTLATGEFVALMDHDDILAEQALFEVVACLNERRDLDLIYSDEDHIDQHGNRSNPYFKPDYNHDTMLGHNLINHFGVYRRALVEAVGGFRLGFEGSQDYDLALRVIDASSFNRIAHIPAVLYHWRSGSGEATFSEASMQRCIDAARRALVDHLARRGERGRVTGHPLVPVWQTIRRPRPVPAPLVSIVIPSKDKAEILGPCVEGLLDRTDYSELEILIVDHQSTDPAAINLLERLTEDPRVTVMPYEGPFNYSAINNAAVARTRGSVLALLNNDVEVINPDWLDEMVALAVLPDVGAVGAKLLYPDNRVQHGGVILGPGGVAGHLFHLLDAHAPGYFGRAVMTSTVAAVTAACLVVRKAVFEEVGGFDEKHLAVAFNDVDLCLKIRERGYRNVWTPQARLYHHESISRGSDQTGERLKRFNSEIEFMMQKWDGVLTSDPFYNPNLNLASGDFSLSFPPRRRKPWRAGLEG